MTVISRVVARLARAEPPRPDWDGQIGGIGAISGWLVDGFEISWGQIVRARDPRSDGAGFKLGDAMLEIWLNFNLFLKCSKLIFFLNDSHNALLFRKLKFRRNLIFLKMVHALVSSDEYFQK